MNLLNWSESSTSATHKGFCGSPHILECHISLHNAGETRAVFLGQLLAQRQDGLACHPGKNCAQSRCHEGAIISHAEEVARCSFFNVLAADVQVDNIAKPIRLCFGLCFKARCIIASRLHVSYTQRGGAMMLEFQTHSGSATLEVLADRRSVHNESELRAGADAKLSATAEEEGSQIQLSLPLWWDPIGICLHDRPAHFQEELLWNLWDHQPSTTPSHSLGILLRPEDHYATFGSAVCFQALK
mmetsp:Transcript_75862/g.180231  ORF Transcript_75862/g.180231 Transcript_75862/m.180231 type:complete len:243 (+) Transcript_75862:233-961(+)